MLPARIRTAPKTVSPPVTCDAGYHSYVSHNSTGNNILVATAVVSDTDIWAVGSSTSPGGFDQTLAEHWDGTSWTIVPTPNPGPYHNDLNAVSALGTNNVWAVGDFAQDAAGTMFFSIVFHWDGTTWSNVTAGAFNPSTTIDILSGVTIVTPIDAWAVGTDLFNTGLVPLVVHWDGSTWTQIADTGPSPTDSELFAVSAFSSTDAWAVGEDSNSGVLRQSLAQHWNGTSWSTVATPNMGTGADNEIIGVNALEAGHAVGVGYGSFVNGVTPRSGEAWDLVSTGTSTSHFESGPGAGDNALLAVARSIEINSPKVSYLGTAVWAVGYWRSTPTSPRETLVIPATWSDTGHNLIWSSTGTSENPSAINNVLLAVSALSAYSFVAAGYDVSGSNVAQTLTEAYCAQHFALSAPRATPAGSAFSVTVTAENGDGTTATGYGGTIYFTSSDGSAVLPTDYSFIAGDKGSHTFTGIALNTAGGQTITVTDTVMPITLPATSVTEVCLGACPAPTGTAGGRAGNTSPSGAAGGRGASGSGGGSPGPRLAETSGALPRNGASDTATTSDAGTNVGTAGSIAVSDLRRWGLMLQASVYWLKL